MESPRPQQDGQRPAVLVVDDEQDVLDWLAQVLGEAGYPSVSASSGAEALELLLSGLRPRVVLVDLMMPNMDGWQLIPAIRALGLPDTAIVSMTAGDGLLAAPVSAGYLQKPFTGEQLVHVISRQVGLPERGAS